VRYEAKAFACVHYVYAMRYAGLALRVDLCISRCVYMDSPKTENKISLIYK